MLSKFLKKELISDLNKVFEYGNIAGIEQVMKVIDLIEHLEDLERYLDDETIRSWIPCIVDRLFGREAYKTCDFNKESNETFILFNPAFLDVETSCVKKMILEVQLNPNKSHIESKMIKFSKELICYLYGGFKWFDSYVRIVEEENLIDKPAVVYFVKDEEVIVDKVKKFKDEYRICQEKQVIKKVYPDLIYPGTIRPFHTPNKIENDVQKDVVKRFCYERIKV